MKQHVFGIIFVSVFAAWFTTSCGSEDTVDSTVGSSTSTTSSTGVGGGPPCNVENQCQCDGQQLLQCSGGNLRVKAQCAPTEVCDAAHCACNCAVGVTRCASEAAVQECVLGSGGVNLFQQFECSPGQHCVDPGECVDVNCGCSNEGEFFCSSTVEDTIVHCQATADGCLQPVQTTSCAAEGFPNGCALGVKSSGAPTDLCRNACNVLGVKLQGELCGVPAGLPCAYLVCNDDGTALVPDQTDCLASGAACQGDLDCVSCFCDSNNLCQGTAQVASCALSGNGLPLCTDHP